MKIPDVVGLTLAEARQALENAGVGLQQVVVTGPPRYDNTNYDEHYRVVRLKLSDESQVELLVCKPL